MTRGQAIRGDDSTIRAPHNASLQTRCELIQLAGRDPLPPASTVAWSRGKKTMHQSIFGEAHGFSPFHGSLGMPGSEVSGRRNDLALIRASKRTGNNVTSPGLFASSLEWPRGEERPLKKSTLPPYLRSVSERIGSQKHYLPIGGQGCESRFIDAGQGGGLSHSLLTTRAALKLAQIANAMLDIATLGFIALFIILLFASPFIAAFCLLFLSF